MKNLVSYPTSASGSSSPSSSHPSTPVKSNEIPSSASGVAVKVTRCSICSRAASSAGESEDPLRYCVDCDVCVHLACYGNRDDGADDGGGDWRCRRCVAAAEAAAEAEKSKACAFCPFTEGAFTSLSSGVWAHVICCLFIPEVSFANPHTMDSAVVPEDESFQTLYRQTCSICDREDGVCRRCDDDDCGTHFHVTCGQALGLLMLEHKEDNMIKFAAYCQSHRGECAGDGDGLPNSQWLPENSSALSAEDITNPTSVSRRVVKKIIYRLAKNLSKTCPHIGTKGADVNAWYNNGCGEFFQKHPNLDRKSVSSYIRNCGLGFYHGCLKRKMASKLMNQKRNSDVNQKELYGFGSANK